MTLDESFILFLYVSALFGMESQGGRNEKGNKAEEGKQI